jgi:ComEC/Rec2-related protein
VTLRLPHAFVGALALGFALANLGRLTPSHALAAAALLGAFGLAAAGGRLRLSTLGLAVVAAAWGWGSLRLGQLDHSALASRIGTAERAVVEVEESPRSGMYDERMRAIVLRWGTLRLHEPVLLQLPLGRSPPVGARLELVGDLRAPPGPSNGFDEATWLRRQGIHAVLRGEGWRVVGRRSGVSGVGDRIGRWLSADTVPGLQGEKRDVIEAIVLGRSSEVDGRLLDDFRATGLYHCLAVDGLKVAAVGGGVAAVVLLLGFGSYTAQIAALLAISGYALAVGLHPSVVRASLAAGLGSLAWLAGRERDRWQALLVGAAVLLGWNPYTLFDAGFQLSFAAVTAIFIVTPRVVRALEGYPVSHELAQLIGVSVACGLATAPVTWFQFHQIAVVTVPANVVAVPIVVEVLGLALLTALVAPVAPSVAAAMAQLNGWGAWLVAVCARAFASVPGAQITSPRAAALLGLGAAGTAAYAWQRGERARAEAGLPPDGNGPAEDRGGAPASARADR